MISKDTYLNWQKQIINNYLFAGFWLFWAVFSLLIFLPVGIVVFLQTDGLKILLLVLLALFLSRVVICESIYLYFKRQRPVQKFSFKTFEFRFLLSHVLKRHDSFPSGHATSFSAIGMTLYFFFPVLGICILLTGLLNGAGRVVLGYHFVSDIFFGYVIGVISSIAVVLLLSQAVFTVL